MSSNKKKEKQKLPSPLPRTLEEKARSGARYVTDVWRICDEHKTEADYETPCELGELWRNMGSALLSLDTPILAMDSSNRLAGVYSALDLTQAFARLVREARCDGVAHIIVRTPLNSGPMLMLQRLEHVRGTVGEDSPLALIVLLGDEQLLLQRHEVPDKESLCRLIFELATGRQERRRNELKRRIHDKEHVVPASEVTAMSDKKFEEQMEAVSKLAEQLEVVQPPTVQELDNLVEDEELNVFLEQLAAEKAASTSDLSPTEAVHP